MMLVPKISLRGNCVQYYIIIIIIIIMSHGNDVRSKRHFHGTFDKVNSNLTIKKVVSMTFTSYFTVRGYPS